MSRTLLYGGLVFLGYVAYKGNQKYQAAKSALSELKVAFVGLTNLSVKLNKVSFDAQIRVSNPTPTDLTLKAGNLVKISELRFYSQDGQFLGRTRKNLLNFELPAYGSVTFKELPVDLAVSNQLIQIITSQNSLGNIADFRIQVDLEVAGATLTLK